MRHLLLNEAKVKDQSDHVRLLTIIILIFVVVNNQFRSLRVVSANVGKILAVFRVSKDVVPWSTLTRLDNDSVSIQTVGQLFAHSIHCIGLLVVFIH